MFGRGSAKGMPQCIPPCAALHTAPGRHVGPVTHNLTPPPFPHLTHPASPPVCPVTGLGRKQQITLSC